MGRLTDLPQPLLEPAHSDLPWVRPHHEFLSGCAALEASPTLVRLRATLSRSERVRPSAAPMSPYEWGVRLCEMPGSTNQRESRC